MEEGTSKESMNWMSAMYAGIVAAIVMMLTLAILGTNIMKMLGEMLVGTESSVALQYFAGGVMHLFVGLVFGVIYGLFIYPIKSMGLLVKALVYGTLLTIVAFFAMPPVGRLMEKAKETYFTKSESMAPGSPAYTEAPAVSEAPAAPAPAAKEMEKKPMLSKKQMKSWLNHFVFVLVLALVYRPKRK